MNESKNEFDRDLNSIQDPLPADKAADVGAAEAEMPKAAESTEAADVHTEPLQASKEDASVKAATDVAAPTVEAEAPTAPTAIPEQQPAAQPTFSNGPAAGAAPMGVPPVGAPYGNPYRPVAPPPPPPPVTTYRWTYADQKAHDAANGKKHRSKGLWTYALVMTGVFALSFGLLLGVMFMKGGELPTIQFSEPETDENGQIISGDDRTDAIAIEKTKQSVVLIEVSSGTTAGSGTGIILSEDGYIATNHHVIEGGTTIRVKFYDGSYATATLRGSSEVDDLAVIKVDRSNLTPAIFARSSECFVGQTVYAIGNPSGADMAWTTTRGCISYVDRELKIYNDDGTLEKKLKMIQTDAMVNPGNSGGPLVNTKGEVIGIVSMKLADGYEGIGFAIPSDGAAEILNAIIKDGHAGNVNSNVSYDRPVIGITGVYMEGGLHYVFEEDRIVEVSESYAKENPDEVISPAVSGIYVRSLTEGTDAATKLCEGDIITAINGVEATNMNVLMNEINEHYAGDVVTVTYHRNGLYTDVEITLSAAKG